MKETYKTAKTALENSEALNIAFLTVYITDQCTLRCEKCANLIPHFKMPQEHNIQRIKNSVDAFLDSIDHIMTLAFLGGETFTYKDLGQLLTYYGEDPRVPYICLDTNGTIVPNSEIIAVLKKYNVRVQISDYGKLSMKLGELIQVLKKNEIEYMVRKVHEWCDFGEPFDRQKTASALKNTYQSCPSVLNKCLYCIDGKFYLCTRTGQMERLGIAAAQAGEFVDLLDSTVNPTMRRDQIQNLLTKEYLSTCNYCDGGCGKPIPVAKQLPK